MVYGVDSTKALRQGVSKLIQQGDIPTKIIKDNKNFFSYFVSASFNNTVNISVSTDDLKYADIKSIYEKESRNESYRSACNIPNLLQLFINYFYKILSKQQTGFRNGSSTQHCLLAILEKLGKSFKAAFTLIYILIVYILLVHKIIYKWPQLYVKTLIHK